MNNFNRFTYAKCTRNHKECIPFGTAAIRNKDGCIVLWVRTSRVGSGQVGSKGIEIPRPQRRTAGTVAGKQDKHTQLIIHRQLNRKIKLHKALAHCLQSDSIRLLITIQ